MVNPFEETRQAGMQQGTPTWDQTSGITHPNLNGYQAWNATHSEGPSLEELRQYNNPNWEYNKAQVNLNEPSARAAEWEQFNKLRGQGYDPLQFLTRPMTTEDDLIDYNEFGDQQWFLQGEISPELEANIPNWYKWYDKLIKRFGEEKGSQLWNQYAADDRGIGSLDEYQMAELTQKQKDMMGKGINTPGFGISKEDLWGQVKDMENKKWDLQWGVQEPTTPEEYDDYYRQLQAGTVGNWVT
jgi:hypothetical protein